MMMVGKYRVSNTSAMNSAYKSAVRVRLDGKLIAEVFIPKHNPLKYVRTTIASKYRDMLIGQLRDSNVPDCDIEMILSIDKGETK